jgi:hypothetical protein
MVHTRATEDVVLDIPEGSADHGHGHGKAPCDSALPLLHRARL